MFNDNSDIFISDSINNENKDKYVKYFHSFCKGKRISFKNNFSNNFSNIIVSVFVSEYKL